MSDNLGHFDPYLSYPSLPPGITNGTFDRARKCSLALLAFSASIRKSNSWGNENSISFDSHSRSYSGKKRFNVEKVNRVSARSNGTHSSSAGCWTLTATFWPVSLSIATWTCASDAAPMGSRSKLEKSSSIPFPVSLTNIASIDSNEETGHWSCSGIKVVVHSNGNK